jgi:hypothetical protein
MDKDGDVEIFDYNTLIAEFGKRGCGNVRKFVGGRRVLAAPRRGEAARPSRALFATALLVSRPRFGGV